MWLANENWSTNYFSIVDQAIENEEIFSTFKSNKSYNGIVGMSFPWQADIWIDYIKKNKPAVLENIKKYSLNDTLGGPENLMYITDDILISPNTLRYINTAIDIENFFRFDKKINVCELGVGYGGLSYIMNCHFDIGSYCLVDTPNVQKLSQKYLTLLGIKTATTDFKKEVDLFVSEFCLSEFDDLEMYRFYEEYIINSKHIYLTMNLHEEDRKEKFLNRLGQDFNFELSEEFPKTQWPNYIVRGSKK